MGEYDPADFEILYPGIYTSRESDLVEGRLASERALEQRGPIDAESLAAGTLPADTPGLGPTLPVTEAMVRYNNSKYDPDNRLLTDAGYARSLGYRDILAMPCYGAHDDSFIVPYPPEARDTLLVSQLNHSVTNLVPVYPGDTLYLVVDRRFMVDRTPTEGSVYRHVTLISLGSVYNQRGEKVNDVRFEASEHVKIFKQSRRPEKMGFAELWEAPDWMSRPAHYYTDADWDFIRGLWAAEQRRGAEALYWEDVNIGDEPAWTVDGPIDESLAPTTPYGMGTGGSRTLKSEIMDPAIFPTMVRGEQDGIYRLPDRGACVPAVPDGAVPFFMVDPGAADDGAVDTKNIHKAGPDRAVLINFLGRDLAIRHLNNWMGDHGWLHNIRWGIMPAEAMAAHGKPVPENPRLRELLERVPRPEGARFVHGLTGDLAIVKSRVYDKYVRDDLFYAELAWWIETIEGDIWLMGLATVKLPSRRVPGRVKGSDAGSEV
jgi:hypothetical protein